MIKEVKEFKRKNLFDYYHGFNNPFIICTTKIDITKIVEYCKIHKNLYATLGFIITQTANEIDAFKYRYKEGKIYYCEEIRSNYVQMYEDETIGYFGIPTIKEFDEYIKTFLKMQKQFLKDKNYSSETELNEIWLSCQPWFSFTSLIPPFDKEVTIPQFIWDKYQKIDGTYSINLMIMVHHGFADGFHVGKFISLLEENIKLFSNTHKM